jgi:hydrogenase maturation protein HypF
LDAVREPYTYDIVSGKSPKAGLRFAPMIVELRPMVRAVVKDVCDSVSSPAISARFHATLSSVILDVCSRSRQQRDIDKVVLSGDVLMNLLLAEAVGKKLASQGFCTFREQRVSANDGGTSLGQLAVIAKRLLSG